MKTTYLALPLIFLCQIVSAEILAPSTTASTSFTLTWSVPSGGISQGIAEQGASNAWMSQPVSISRPNGSHTFVQGHCYVFPFGSRCFNIDTHTVVVNATPAPDPEDLIDQLQYDYESRVGDFNGDGMNDVLVDRLTSSPGLDGSMQSFILQQAPGNTFSTVVPTSSQHCECKNVSSEHIDSVKADRHELRWLCGLDGHGVVDRNLRWNERSCGLRSRQETILNTSRFRGLR